MRIVVVARAVVLRYLFPGFKFECDDKKCPLRGRRRLSVFFGRSLGVELNVLPPAEPSTFLFPQRRFHSPLYIGRFRVQYISGYFYVVGAASLTSRSTRALKSTTADCPLFSETASSSFSVRSQPRPGAVSSCVDLYESPRTKCMRYVRTTFLVEGEITT